MWFIILVLMCLCFMCFDIWYFLRFLISILICSFNKTKSLFEDNIVYGICLTTDLDFMFHMNNARYLRECDFGRFKFFIQNRSWDALESLGGCMSNAGNNIRYRRSIELFNIYKIKTRLLYWDDRAFYVEQHVIRTKDNFICAVNIVKQTLIGVSPAKVVEKLGIQDQPEMTDELKCLLESWRLSSETLRK